MYVSPPYIYHFNAYMRTYVLCLSAYACIYIKIFLYTYVYVCVVAFLNMQYLIRPLHIAT